MIIKRMRKLLFLIFLCFLSYTFAESESEENAAATNNEQSEAQKDKQTTSTINTPDSFDPTETLSQDIPAAFPVDI